MTFDKNKKSYMDSLYGISTMLKRWHTETHKKRTQRLQKIETRFRTAMIKLAETYGKDEKNKALVQQLKSSYKSGVTKFMKDSIAMLKKVK